MSSQRNFFDSYAKGQSFTTGFSSSTAQVQSTQSNFEGRKSELEGEQEAILRFAQDNLVVASGSTDYSKLSTLKDAILALKSSYFSTGGIAVKGEKRDDLDRRFLLIEHEIDGLLRRRIEFSSKDYEGGSRFLDFTNILNEKENQIIELEKKINNLEERLRRASAREVELENKIVALRAENIQLRDKSLSGDKLYNAIQRENDLEKATKEIETLKANFASAASVWKNQLSKLVAKYPTEKADLDYEISAILQKTGVNVYPVNGVEVV